MTVYWVLSMIDILRASSNVMAMDDTRPPSATAHKQCKTLDFNWMHMKHLHNFLHGWYIMECSVLPVATGWKLKKYENVQRSIYSRASHSDGENL